MPYFYNYKFIIFYDQEWESALYCPPPMGAHDRCKTVFCPNQRKFTLENLIVFLTTRILKLNK